MQTAYKNGRLVLLLTNDGLVCCGYWGGGDPGGFGNPNRWMISTGGAGDPNSTLHWRKPLIFKGWHPFPDAKGGFDQDESGILLDWETNSVM